MNVTATPAPVSQPKKWTVLVYSAADNDLQDFMIDDVDEMERVGSDGSTNLVVQLDTGQAVRRMLLQKDSAQGIHSPVVENLGAQDMAAPATLADFVEWGIKNYPAQHYMLVISDHGDGWKGACQDDSHGNWMSLPDIRRGLEEAQKRTGVKLDVLGFDACNMGSAEVAYELRDTAGYLVASEKTEAAEGWPYSRWLTEEVLRELQQANLARLDMPPDQLARLIVQAASKHQNDIETLSATDLSQVGRLGQALDELGRAILATPTSVWRLKKQVWNTQSFEGYRDAYDFASRLRQHPKIRDQRLKDAAAGVMDAVKKAVIAEQHHPDHAGAHGLTLNIPTWFGPGGDYKTLAISQDTYWDEGAKQITRWWTRPRPVD
ncbi:MAG TPA: clostripain-related cysteine peptidase [Candidatus Nitrosotenuis sp.]|jgi:hypothetical protein|nr:clostripain-related cysteine peptidase [Candidatus Nitrosotenuis sp.]